MNTPKIADYTTRKTWRLSKNGELMGEYDSETEAIEQREALCGINDRDAYLIAPFQQMIPRIAADYTSRKSYQQNYAKENREAINARKKAWRLARKNLSGGVESRHAQSAQTQGKPQAVPAVGLRNLHGSGSSAPSAQTPLHPVWCHCDRCEP